MIAQETLQHDRYMVVAIAIVDVLVVSLSTLTTHDAVSFLARRRFHRRLSLSSSSSSSSSSSVRVELFDQFVPNGRVFDPQQHDDGGVGGHLGVGQRVGHAQERNVLGAHFIELERVEGNVEEDVAQIRVGADQKAVFLLAILAVVRRKRLDE